MGVIEDTLSRYRALDMFRDYEVNAFDQPGMDGDMPLHIAAFSGDIEGLRIMLPLVRSIDLPGGIGNTALHYAVLGGRAAAVELLLTFGANPSVRNDYGDAPLDMLQETNDEIEACFKRHGVG